MITVQPLPVSTGGANGEAFIFPTVIRTATELILVDAGYPEQADAIFSAAAGAGFDLQNLTKIILTHHDFDHVGSLLEIKTRCPAAMVITSAGEALFIEGSEKALRLQQAEQLVSSLPETEKESARQFEQFLKTIAPCPVDTTVKDGDAIDADGSVIVVETPGHTAGHLSLFIPATNTLLAGDALVFEKGELQLANPGYAYSLPTAKASAEKIKHMHLSTIICYHGGTCRDPQQTPFII